MNPWLWRVPAALLALGCGVWLVQHTEWVETRTPVPLSPEMERDGTQVAQTWLRQLGLQARRVDDLATLPPPGATLVLAAAPWGLFAGTPERVQRWVEQDGGHLVIDGSMVPHPEDESWLPVRWAVRRDALDDDEEVPRVRFDWCRVLEPPPALGGAWGSREGFVSCLSPRLPLALPAQARWALHSGEMGIEAVRVPAGRGTVTASASWFAFDARDIDEPRNLSNRGLLYGDNAALLAALVDARPGGEVWFVNRLKRPPLPLWLAQQAGPALALAAVALLLALWRGGARFGPLQAPPPQVRRSLAAQVRGLADFLFRHQPRTLHAAALRALDESARGHVAAWSRLDRSARAAALARAVGLPADRLAAALDPALPRSAAAWSDALALIETTRRALRAPRRP